MNPGEREAHLGRAVPLIVLAGLFFASLDTTAKYLVQANSLLLVVWARYVGQMLVTTPIAWHRGGPAFWKTRHLGLQMVRSACLAGATVCFVGALRYLPLAEGTAIAFLAPLLAIVLAMPVLGERPTRARWVAAMAGFAGIVILVRPGSAVFHPAAGLMMLAALSNAFYQLLTRRVPADSPYTTLFYSGLAGTAIFTATLPFAGIPTSFAWTDAFFLLLLGLLAGMGHWLLIGAFLAAPASMVAPFTYIHMIWATIFGYAVFHQLPDGLSALGMTIIVGSGVGLFLHERALRGWQQPR